jgi:hypothetical protein
MSDDRWIAKRRDMGVGLLLSGALFVVGPSLAALVWGFSVIDGVAIAFGVILVGLGLDKLRPR